MDWIKRLRLSKRNFDYVILDTAPVGMVTDTLLIGRVADLSVYVCRADYTRKNDYTLINELIDGNKLPNLCTVINGLDLKKESMVIITVMVNMASIMVMVNDTAMVMDMENNLVRKNKSIDNQDILKLIMS